MSCVLVRGARQLLTLRGPREPRRGVALNDPGIIQNGAVLIEDGRIAEVGPTRRVENLALAKSAREIDASSRVVMPGFVDCHTHLMGGPEAPDLTIRNTSTARLTSRAAQIVSLMAKHGTTTMEAKSGYGGDEAGEFKILHVHTKIHRRPVDVVSTFLCPRDVPAGFAGGEKGFLAAICSEWMPKIKSSGLCQFADCYGATGWMGPEDRNRFFAAAEAMGMRTKVHASGECIDEGVQMAVAKGAVSADHLEHASSVIVDLIAHSKTMAVVLPASAWLKGAGRLAPARELIDAGAAVAIASDFDGAEAPMGSMLMAVGLACSRLKMTAAEAIGAATLNAAYAIGRADLAGSLEVGKLGDLVVLNAEDYREIPYYMGSNLVALTIKRGVTIYRE